MTEIVDLYNFRDDLDKEIQAEIDARKLLSRSEYARRGAERKKFEGQQKRAHNKSIVMICSPITSPDDLSAIIAEHRDTCMQIARRYAHGDENMAEDIYQEALYKAFQHLKKGDPYYASQKLVKRIQQDDDQKVDWTVRQVVVKNPAAWLHTIVRNTGLNECARRKRTNALLKEIKEDAERESRRFEQPEVIVLRNISNSELHYYINCLPGHFSKIIDLHYFGAFSYEEIAKVLERPPSTVRVSAKRALNILKDVLQNKRDVEGGNIGRPKKAG